MEQLKTTITREDILDGLLYEEQREEQRKRIWKIKNNRRLSVGPHATFYFESYDTMLYQIHEMVRIEKGGEDQIRDELEAYNSLVPTGKEFVATLMFEINDPYYRTQILNGLGGVEEGGFMPGTSWSSTCTVAAFGDAYNAKWSTTKTVNTS